MMVYKVLFLLLEATMLITKRFARICKAKVRHRLPRSLSTSVCY
jgi:hypothetical protein